MQRALFLILVVLAFMSAAWSQEYTPKVEIGLGYSYSRASVPNSASRANMNGLVISTAVNVNRWFGAEAEFGTHYHCISGCWIENIRVDNPDARNDSLSFLAGPKITFNRERRVSPWVHSLFGVTKISYLNILTIPDTRMSNTGFGMSLGGGLDVNLTKFTIRAVQVDYTRFAGSPSPSNNIRVGGGIVLRIGHKSTTR